jgi:cytochrome c oxidase assembly protein subunit 15
VVTAWRRRAEPGVGGAGGVLRAAGLAVALWFVPAVLGAVAVWLALPAIIVVAHLAVAMALLAVLAVVAMRAGGLGAARALAEGGAPRTARAALAAAALALVVVLLGGLTANVPGAAPACQGFPLCNGSVIPRGGLQHLHFTHRVLAYLLALHVVGLGFAVGRRGESRAVVRAARAAMAVVILQILVGAALVETFLPRVLQSMHQAVGTLVWLTLFVLAALARRAARGSQAPVSATHAPDRAPAVAARGAAS